MIEFAKAITMGENFSINATDGARATICALKAYESIKNNKPMKITRDEYELSYKKA